MSNIIIPKVSIGETTYFDDSLLAQIKTLKDEITAHENDIVLLRETLKGQTENLSESEIENATDFVQRTQSLIVEKRKTLIRLQEKARIDLEDEIAPNKDLMTHGLRTNKDIDLDNIQSQVTERTKVKYHRRTRDEIALIWIERISAKNIDMTRIFTIRQLADIWGIDEKKINHVERSIIKELISSIHRGQS